MKMISFFLTQLVMIKKKKIIDENRLRILTKHNIFTKDKISGETSMDLDEESAGTNRLLAVGWYGAYKDWA